MRTPASPIVARPVMYQSWCDLTFAHWRYAPGVVRPLLPAGLDVQSFAGEAWVGLVPFVMRDVRPPLVPAAPWLSRFPETNLRTYVDGPSGSGIWFFSLEAARLPAVLVARAGFGLPYHWARMAAERCGDRVRYRSTRRWPGSAGVRADLDVEVGEPLAPGDFDHFLTARHRLYSVWGGRLVTAEAAHAPWPLRHARARVMRLDLLRAAGLPDPDDATPLLHASDGVDVRIGMWHFA